MTDQEFSKLYNELKRPIGFYAVSKVDFNVEVADDIVQDVFLQLLQQSRKGKVIENPKAYLRTLVDSAVVQKFRQSYRHQKAVAFKLVEDGTPLAQDDTLKMVIEAANEIIPQMPPDMAYIIQYTFLENDEVTHEQVMEHLGIKRWKYFELKKKGLMQIAEFIRKRENVKVPDKLPKQ